MAKGWVSSGWAADRWSCPVTAGSPLLVAAVDCLQPVYCERCGAMVQGLDPLGFFCDACYSGTVAALVDELEPGWQFDDTAWVGPVVAGVLAAAEEGSF